MESKQAGQGRPYLKCPCSLLRSIVYCNMSTHEQVNTYEVVEMKDLFTVHQVSRCCGISRATILRLENKGLLRPAYIDAQSGYRYYDNDNVSRIMQIQLFLKMGMPYDDIQLYYRMGGASQELLKQAEARLSITKRLCEEIRLRVKNREHLSFGFVNLPRYVCFTGEFRGATVESRYWAMYHLYHQVVERGYRLLATEPLFVINRRHDFICGTFTEKVVDFTCCIPLEPDNAPKDAVVYPACRAFSCLYHGNYDRCAEVFNAFGAKIRELGLRPTGYVRSLALVAPYTGQDISSDNYLTRLAVPVEE